MEQCCFIDDPAPRTYAPSASDWTLPRWAAAAASVLRYLFTPESGNTDAPQPGPRRPGWMGPLKGLLWVALSIAAGTLLAIGCS